MEFLPKNEILEFHPDTLEVVRKLYNLDKPGAMKESVHILDKWIKTQHHFTKKDFSPDYLERLIITNKGSIERSKERLDKLFTFKTLMPKYFQDFDPLYDFQNIKGIIQYAPLPKMTPDYDRVYICKTQGKKFTSQLFSEGYRFSLMNMEYFRAHDYSRAFYFVLDYLNVGIPELIAAADLVELRQAVVALIDGYGTRVKGVHILVNSKLVDVLISIAKQVVSEKIANRLYTHKSYEEMYKHVPREVFPKELGGEYEKSWAEIHDDWWKVLSSEKFNNHWNMMLKARTDESLRQTDKFNDQYMGMPGTFRSLSVD